MTTYWTLPELQTGNSEYSGSITFPATGILFKSNGTLLKSGAHSLTLTTTNTTNVTLPTTGTLATLGGVENFTGNKTFSGTLEVPATVTYTGAGSIVKSGAHALTMTTTNTTNATFPTGTVTLAQLGAQTFMGLQTISVTATDALVLNRTDAAAGLKLQFNGSDAGVIEGFGDDGISFYAYTNGASITEFLRGTGSAITSYKAHTFSAGATVASGQTLTLTGATVAGPVSVSSGAVGEALDITSSDTDIRLRMFESATQRGMLQYASSDFRLVAGSGVSASIWAAGQSIISTDGATITLSKPVTANGIANPINMVGVVANPCYISFDQAVNNSGKRWRVGHTGGVTGSTSFDIYNQTDNLVAFTVASTGAVTIGPASGASSHTLYTGTATANGFVYTDGPAITGNASRILGVYNNTSARAYIAATRHAAISDAVGVLVIRDSQSPTGTHYVMWNYNGIWRSTSTTANIGTSGGDVIGDQTSDIRLKSDVVESAYGLHTVLSVTPIEYTIDGERRVGFSAQDLQKSLPTAVYESGTPIDDSGVTRLVIRASQDVQATMWKAIQELAAKLDSVSASYDALEARIAALESK